MVDVLWESEAMQASGNVPWNTVPLEVFSTGPFFFLASLAEASNSLVSKREQDLPKVGLCHGLGIHTIPTSIRLSPEAKKAIQNQLDHALSRPFRFPPTTCHDYYISVTMQSEDITSKHREQALTNNWQKPIWSAEEEFEKWFGDNWILHEGERDKVVIQNTPSAAFLMRADPPVPKGWQWSGPFWAREMDYDSDTEDNDGRKLQRGVRPKLCTLKKLQCEGAKAAQAAAAKAAQAAKAEAAKAAAAEAAAAKAAKTAAKAAKKKMQKAPRGKGKDKKVVEPEPDHVPIVTRGLGWGEGSSSKDAL